MRLIQIFIFFASPFFLIANPSQIAYLMQVNQPEKAITLYERYKNELGKHDFEVLQQMALILLEQGAKASDQETQLLSIFGSGIANRAASLDVLEAGVKSTHAETQLASIQFLGRMQDDRSDELLVKAMSSEFFQARLEAAMHLAARKHKTSVGQIESLMYRVPPQARFFFPQFFALIGTSDAISILRHLMEDPTAAVRVEALLSAARFGRDDLLPIIRMNITHCNVAEQEAAAFAVGLLKDTNSLQKLKRLFTSSTSNVQIAAARSLLILGDPQAKDFLLQQAKGCNLFAIVSLAEIPEGKEILAELCNHPDLTVRMNAAVTLLKHRDPRCCKTMLEILVRDTRDMGFAPQISLGRTMMALKPIFSTTQQPTTFFDHQGATLAIRQQLLAELMHLPEEDFLTVAKILLDSEQIDLVPMLVTLLESLQTDGALAVLKTKAQQAGKPLMRAYCNLALYRLGKEGPYESYLKDWLSRNKDSEMIRFRPVVTLDKRMVNSPHELTPEDSSRLLIEMYQTLAEKQQASSVDVLLDAISHGNVKNRYVLAGLLLRTLQ